MPFLRKKKIYCGLLRTDKNIRWLSIQFTPIIPLNILAKKKVSLCTLLWQSITLSSIRQPFPQGNLRRAGSPVRFILDGLLHYQPVLQPKLKRKDKVKAPVIPKEHENSEDNEDEINRLHSTDQHDINYINSAICYLLGIEFQPRFKQIHKVKLYGVAGMPIIQQLDYQINAGNNINTKIIVEQWGRPVGTTF